MTHTTKTNQERKDRINEVFNALLREEDAPLLLSAEERRALLQRTFATQLRDYGRRYVEEVVRKRIDEAIRSKIAATVDEWLTRVAVGDALMKSHMDKLADDIRKEVETRARYAVVDKVSKEVHAALAKISVDIAFDSPIRVHVDGGEAKRRDAENERRAVFVQTHDGWSVKLARSSLKLADFVRAYGEDIDKTRAIVAEKDAAKKRAGEYAPGETLGEDS